MADLTACVEAGGFRSMSGVPALPREPLCGFQGASYASAVLVLQSHIHSDGTYGLSIGLVSSIADAQTEAKFHGLHGLPPLTQVICDCSTKLKPKWNAQFLLPEGEG